MTFTFPWQRAASSAPPPNLDLIEQFAAALSDAVVLYDASFRIVSCNASFARLVRLQPITLRGLEVTSSLVNSPEYRRLALIFFPAVMAERLEVIQAAPVEIVRISLTTPEELHFRIAALKLNLPARLAGGGDTTYAVKVITDETNQVIRDREITEFLELSAHHMRTPLNEIKWSLESINLKSLAPETVAPIRTSLDTIKIALALAEGILMSIEVETGGLKVSTESSQLGVIVDAALDILANSIAERQLKIGVEIAPEAEQFVFDKKIFLVILHAIFENAVRYNRAGGTVNIKARRLTERPVIEISVVDSGVGIPTHEQGRMFERHFRGDQGRELKPEGFGLGLYMTKRLVELIGGSVSFISKEGEGSTFSLYIPADAVATKS